MNFTVTHKGKRYHWGNFDNTNEVYIFCLGIEFDVETKLQTDMDTVIEFVMQCHNQDCNNAPLRPFVAFIVDWWNELRNRDKQYVVNKFYEIKN